MKPPRWDSRNAGLVRDELLRRVRGEAVPGAPSPAPVPAQRRIGTARVVVAFLVVLAFVVPASVLAVSQQPRPVSGGAVPTAGAVPGRSTGSAAGGSRARVLLTEAKDVFDGLTGTTIAPAELGVAANGCLTLGPAYLRAGYGSALLEDGGGAALSDIGDYRIGQILPPVYGYHRIYTRENLPADRGRCGPGNYVDVLYSKAKANRRASTLLVGGLDRGEKTTLNGFLASAGNGCVRVGGEYLIAPKGSTIDAGGSTISIAEAGKFTFGAGMPALPARRTFYTAAELPLELRACGPGSYIAVTGPAYEPVLTYDPVDDSARMVVRPSSDGPAPTTRTEGGVLGRRNTCVTVGDSFLSAPQGSSVLDDGRRIRLRRIGTFTIGEVLPPLPGRLVTYTEASLPVGILDCGPGTYAEVWAP